MRNLAAYLLALIAVRNYGWQIVEPAMRGGVSKALGAATILALLLLVYKMAAVISAGVALISRLAAELPAASQVKYQLGALKLVFYAAAYGAFEELQTVICSTAYAFNPWTVPEGQSICSARIDFDLGAIGVMLLAFVLHKIAEPVRSTSVQDNNDRAS